MKEKNHLILEKTQFYNSNSDILNNTNINNYKKIEFLPIKINREMLPIISKIIGIPKALSYILTNIGVSVLISFFQLKLSLNWDIENGDLYEKIIPELANLGSEDRNANNKDNLIKFQSKLILLSKHATGFVLIAFLENLILDTLKHSLNNEITDSLIKKKFSSQTAYFLNSDHKTSIQTRTILQDGPESVEHFMNLDKSFFQVTQNAITSFFKLLIFSKWINIGLGIKIPDLISASIVMTLLTKTITSLFNEKINAISLKIYDLSIKFIDITEYDQTLIKSITERDGEKYIQERYFNLLKDIRKFEWQLINLRAAISAWYGVKDNIKNLMSIYFIGKNIYDSGNVKLNFHVIKNVFKNVDTFIEWSDNNLNSINYLQRRIDRIKLFLENKELIELGNDLLLDYHKESSIIVSDFKLRIFDKVILDLPYFKFEKGNRYLITGASGSGKTSFLSKLGGLIDPYHFKSTGKIIYPYNFKKSTITQDDYFPKYSTLMEVIFFPKLIPNDQKQLDEFKLKIKKLLIEISIDGSNNNSSNSILDLIDSSETHDWSTRLSGGQKKKIQIVSQIIKKPDFMILDEVFNGLDNFSIKLAHQMILKYLPDTMIVAIDHNGLTHNNFSGENFFNIHIQMRNSTFEVSTLGLTENFSGDNTDAYI